MGLFGKIFGGEEKVQHPPLDSSSPGASLMEAYKSQLEPFILRVNDKFEIVPVNDAAYVFVGKPPGMFGVVWFLKGDNKEHSFKSLMADRGLPQTKIQLLSDNLREVYVRHQSAPRFSATLGGKTVTVTPDVGLANEVHEIIQKASA